MARACADLLLPARPGPVPAQMATLETAEQLLEELRGASFEAAKRDLQDIQEFAAEQGSTEPLQQVCSSPGAPPRAAAAWCACMRPGWARFRQGG